MMEKVPFVEPVLVVWLCLLTTYSCMLVYNGATLGFLCLSPPDEDDTFFPVKIAQAFGCFVSLFLSFRLFWFFLYYVLPKDELFGIETLFIINAWAEWAYFIAFFTLFCSWVEKFQSTRYVHSQFLPHTRWLLFLVGGGVMVGEFLPSLSTFFGSDMVTAWRVSDGLNSVINIILCFSFLFYGLRLFSLLQSLDPSLFPRLRHSIEVVRKLTAVFSCCFLVKGVVFAVCSINLVVHHPSFLFIFGFMAPETVLILFQLAAERSHQPSTESEISLEELDDIDSESFGSDTETIICYPEESDWEEQEEF